MKFRTDFVTNSSDSSFLVFNVMNKRLFETLENLGIKIEKVKQGEFTDELKVTLPSGESETIDGSENWDLPYLTECKSISAWLVALILWEVEHFDPPKPEDEYSDFAKELITLLNEAEITHLDWKAVENWSREGLIQELETAFGEMDSDIEEAEIEYIYGFEGDVETAIYTSVHDGKRLLIDYTTDNEIETDSCEEKQFVVIGKLKYYESKEALLEYIEENGGEVSDTISDETTYLICNDLESAGVMAKVMENNIPVLTEAAFIRRFSDPEEFEGLIDEDQILEEAWECTYGGYDGGLKKFVMDSGVQPIKMQSWNGKEWVSK